MKRHPALVPLSHDHRQLLFLAQSIKYGPARYRDAPNSVAEKYAFLQAHVEALLIPHFTLEETVLAPFVCSHAPALTPLIHRLAPQHAGLSAAIQALDTTDDRAAPLDTLGHQLEAHIRYEERQLFQQLQAALTDDVLHGLGAQIRAVHRQACFSWPLNESGQE